MTNSAMLIAISALIARGLLGQTPPEQTGAKAIFFDSINDKQVNAQLANTTRKPHAPQATLHETAKLPVVTGLMYYVELLRPNGELARVNSDHIFHSGDRIHLHLESNIDGNLVIYQSEDNSSPEVLFPSPRVGDGSGRVAKGTDVVLPSSKAWFRFDDHPGRIVLSLKLSADQTTLPADESKTTLLADAGAIRDLRETQTGSKALVIDTDDSPTDASKIVVVDTRRDSKMAPGQIAVEISLVHRP